MSAEAGELAGLSIQDRKRQGGGKLLPASNRGLEEVVESEAPNRAIRLQSGVEPTDTEIA